MPRSTATSTITVTRTTTITRTATDGYASQASTTVTSTTTITSVTSVYTENYVQPTDFILQVSSDDPLIDGTYLQIDDNGQVSAGAASPVAAAFASEATRGWFEHDQYISANVNEQIDSTAGADNFVPVQFGGPGEQLSCYVYCYGQWECTNQVQGPGYAYIPFAICPETAAADYTPNILYFGTVPAECNRVNLTVVDQMPASDSEDEP